MTLQELDANKVFIFGQLQIQKEIIETKMNELRQHFGECLNKPPEQKPKEETPK
jgi:hypothetical protein